MRKLMILIILVATAAIAFSQEPSKPAAPATQDNPFTTHNNFVYGGLKLQNIVPPTSERGFSQSDKK